MTDGAKSRARFVHDTMREELRAMEVERDAHWEKYETLAQECVTIESAIQVMQERAAGREQENPPYATAPAPVLLDDISFDGCENNGERLVRMAESWGGTVNSHDAADRLISMGIAKGSRSNLVSALQKLMTDREDLWEYVEPRTYRLLLHRSTHNDEPDDAALDTPNGVAHSPVMNNFE